jgi:hypothetical protein
MEPCIVCGAWTQLYDCGPANRPPRKIGPDPDRIDSGQNVSEACMATERPRELDRHYL